MELQKFTDFARKFNIAQNTLPLLLIEQIAYSNSGDAVFKTIPSQKSSFMLSIHGRKAGSKPLDNAIIFSFHQAEKSVHTGISVGRAASNKICLPDNSVSKMHASFKQTTDGKWVIIDVASENKTRVNNKVIESNKPFEIKNGDGITFSDTYHCTFFTPDGFKAYIDSLESF